MSTDAEWNPQQKTRTMLGRIETILEDGEERTVRDIYYALESYGYDYDYDKVKYVVKRGRRAGFINPRQVVDPSRPPSAVAAPGFDDLGEFVDSTLDGIEDTYYENFWGEQDTYVEVWLEKASLASVFEPICEEWNVRLEATRGDWSDAKMFRAAQRIAGKISDGKDIHIAYFGDYNPSGYHAPVAVLKTMECYGIDLQRDGYESDDPRYFLPSNALASEIGGSEVIELAAGERQVDDFPAAPYRFADDEAGTLTFDRKALLTEHIRRFELPENPTPSKSDKDRTIRDRFTKYVSGGRDVNVELNALKEFEREFLEKLIEESIRDHVNIDAKQRVEDRVRDRRATIRDSLTLGKKLRPAGDSP